MDEGHGQCHDVMKVSIIIPVYNVSAYVDRCLDSVYAQTYKNIECILIDDCSTDDSYKKCEEYVNSHERRFPIVMLKHERNRGLSAARNTGTDAAVGDYIFYLDSDDEIIPECISLLVAKVNEVENVDVVCGAVVYEPKPERYDISWLYDHPVICGNKNVRAFVFGIKKVFPVSAWNKLVRRGLIIENQIRFKEGLLYEDNLWTFYWARKAEKVALVFDKTYIHYQIPGSIMSTSVLEKRDFYYRRFLAEIFENIDNPLFDVLLMKYTGMFVNVFKSSDNQSKEMSQILITLLNNRGFYLLASLLHLQSYINCRQTRGIVCKYTTNKNTQLVNKAIKEQ